MISRKTNLIGHSGTSEWTQKVEQTAKNANLLKKKLLLFHANKQTNKHNHRKLANISSDFRFCIFV